MRTRLMESPRSGLRLPMTLVGAAVCALAVYVCPLPWGAAPRFGWACSLLVLTLSIATLHPYHWTVGPLRDAGGERIAHHVALYVGVAAGMILVVLLTMRSVYVGIDLIHGYPWQGARNYGFEYSGLRTIAALFVACGLGLVATRDGRLVTIQLWLLVAFAAWGCLLSSPFQATRTGGFERTDATLILVECLAGFALVAVLLVGWMTETGFLRGHPPETSPLVQPPDDFDLPHGFRASVAVLLLALNFAVLFHILVPAGQSTFMLRMSGIRAGVAALIAAFGGAILLRRSWGAQLADATLGLFALGLAGLSLAAVPSTNMSLDERFPMIFNSITVGYAFAAGIFAQLSWTWSAADLSTLSTRKRMVPHVNRFAFFCGATALLAGVMMSFWPGVPGVSTMDHSLGRVIAGFAAFLFLLLVTLRSSRLFERLSFHFLTVAVAACMVAFLVMRVLPFLSDASR